jgi:magnesium transporter
MHVSSLKHTLDRFRTKKVTQVNPTQTQGLKEPEDIKVFVYDYHSEEVVEQEAHNVTECYKYLNSEKVSWINIDGLRKDDIESVCTHFGIHHLIMDDILSLGHRPKMDQIDGILFALMNMLYFNEDDGSIETEQISIALGKNFVISFQEEPYKDVFDELRKKIKLPGSKVRQNGADFLFYSLLDTIVDHYFLVTEKVGERIELLEEEIVENPDSGTNQHINTLRKEMILLKRTVGPMRDVIGRIVHSECKLIEDNTEKYFKDVYDHIVQCNELADNYHDMITNLQDLYINNVSLKMNEVMKVLTIVTCILAPAAIITGLFGMNFDNMPLEHTHYGLVATIGVMLLIPIWMVWLFRKRKWF